MDDALSLRYSPLSVTESDDPYAHYYRYQFHNAGKTFRQGSTPYKQTMAIEVDPGNVTYPFTGLNEWELAKWLGTTGLPNTQIDAFLNLSLGRIFFHYMPNVACLIVFISG
ncbi:hypothetical protein BU17DRAFT_46412 [Hysterangium stoloniferum]|nr:hypothetical protein BU17DRAFT_46412 [Hysterangium stoloniferum]